MPDDLRHDDQKRNWKAVQLDYDSLAASGDETTVHELSPTTRAICLALLRTAAWPTRYWSDSGAAIDADVVRQMAAIAEYELMREVTMTDCCDAILAQLNQLNTAISNQTKASGESSLQEIDDAYDGTTGSIAPDAVYDGSADDGDRDAALCYALFSIIDATLDAIAQDKENWKKETAMVAGATASLGVTLAAFTAGLSALVATAIAGGISLVSQAYMATVSEDDLRDADAREEILCLAYDRMVGQTPTTATLAAAFDYDSNLSDVAEKQRGIMDVVVSTIESYYAFARTMNEGFEISQNVGLDNPCIGCGECGDWEHVADMSVDAGGMEVFDVWPQYDGVQFIGEYDGTRWLETTSPYPPVTDGFRGYIIRRQFAVAATINRVVASFDAKEGYRDKGVTYPFSITLFLNGNQVYQKLYVHWGDGREANESIGGVLCDEIRLSAMVSIADHPDNVSGGYANLWSFRVCGDGTNPWS